METTIYEFADKLNEIMPLIAKEFMKKNFSQLYKEKITLPQFFILDLLNREGQSKMTDLSHFMNVTTAAMTGIVERLVKCGYVQRIYGAEDRRIIMIRPTAKGSALVKKINLQKTQMVINTFGKITRKEREDYLRILLRIHEILSKGE